VLASQLGDELLVCIRLGTAQPVIEMDDREDNSDFAAQLQQQAQQGD
jgi:hypothetical protein